MAYLNSLSDNPTPLNKAAEIPATTRAAQAPHDVTNAGNLARRRSGLQWPESAGFSGCSGASGLRVGPRERECPLHTGERTGGYLFQKQT